MAPEYIWQGVVSRQADIYSLGVIIIEMITGCRIGPFSITVTSCQDFVEPVRNYVSAFEMEVLWTNDFTLLHNHSIKLSAPSRYLGNGETGLKKHQGMHHQN